MAGSSDADVFERLGLAELPQQQRDGLARTMRQVALAAGTTVFSPGEACAGWILVEEGSVRVFLTADTGREILLYRVGPGESCVLTTACLFGEEVYAATGIAETDTRALLIPAPTVLSLIESSTGFRRLVFRGFGHRITDILATLEDTVFHPLEARLAKFLLARADAGGVVVATQAEIAAELGSAREVVARQLGRMTGEGLVERERGRIRLLRPDLLACRAEAAGR
ncbi:Crp/Fnr family transcriptional regulator [Polymorphum gilvum]|uniref:Transcriptional regulator, Nnr-like protein n=1 Tax=Polymorphum gilvum (strain LMG 25793 / CGMCC 1.9160 / SL003B-26A1) TaxID=991905 RepID=F2IV63_POLGS|nr:Crp/Fnr family transcriptional regulator [Polymorphum gilvum]ADZ71394.1 Transcriptional regulator, Nnr-like protein [Polymorphum gilvum SL003B-26A1]